VTGEAIRCCVDTLIATRTLPRSLGEKKADQRSAQSVPALRGAQPEHERLFNKITVIPLFKRQSASRASSSATVKRLDTRPDHAGNRAVAQQHHTGEHTTAAIIPSRQQLARCGGDWMPPILNARFSCPGLLQGRTTLRAFCANVESRIRQCRLGGSRLVLDMRSRRSGSCTANDGLWSYSGHRHRHDDCAKA
jgi:hypothetical protein